MKKLLLVLLLIPLVSCSDEFDLENIAKKIESEFKGKDVGDGFIVKKVLSANNTLIFIYSIPNDTNKNQIQKKSDLIKSIINTGYAKFFVEMGTDIQYIYKNRSGVTIKTIYILNYELAKSDLKDYEDAKADKTKSVQMFPPVDSALMKKLDLEYKGMLDSIMNGTWQVSDSIIVPDWAKPENIIYVGKTAKEYLDEGLSLELEKDYEGAIVEFSRAIKVNPDYAEAYYSRGTLKNYLEDYIDAIADLTKAIELNPNFPAAYHNRAFSNRRLKNYKAAIFDNTKAIELNPDYTISYAARGTSKRDLKDHIGAIADYTKAIELNPNFSAAFSNRGISKKNLKDYEGAISDYNKAIELNPDYIGAYVNRGVAKETIGDLSGACKDYRKAVSLGYEDAVEWVRKVCN